MSIYAPFPTGTVYTNPGTAGGTNSFFYGVNGGVKFFWGLTGVVTVNVSTGVTAGLTFPASFFSSITTAVVTPLIASGDVRISESFSAISTTSATIAFWNTAALTTSTANAYVFVMGT